MLALLLLSTLLPSGCGTHLVCERSRLKFLFWNRPKKDFFDLPKKSRCGLSWTIFFLDLLDQSLNQKMNDLPSSTPVSESKPMGSFYLSKAYRIFYIAIHAGSRAHREEWEQEGTQKYNSHDALWSHRQAQTVPFNQKEPVIILYLAMELSTEINLFLRKIWIETNSSVW